MTNNKTPNKAAVIIHLAGAFWLCFNHTRSRIPAEHTTSQEKLVVWAENAVESSEIRYNYNTSLLPEYEPKVAGNTLPSKIEVPPTYIPARVRRARRSPPFKHSKNTKTNTKTLICDKCKIRFTRHKALGRGKYYFCSVECSKDFHRGRSTVLTAMQTREARCLHKYGTLNLTQLARLFRVGETTMRAVINNRLYPDTDYAVPSVGDVKTMRQHVEYLRLNLREPELLNNLGRWVWIHADNNPAEGVWFWVQPKQT